MRSSIPHLLAHSFSPFRIGSDSTFAEPSPNNAVVEDQAPRLAWVKGIVGFILLLVVCASCAVLVLNATPASAEEERVPVNGCFQNGMWGWARRTDPGSSPAWDGNGHNNGHDQCGKFKMQGGYRQWWGWPDFLYSMRIKIGPSARLSFYASSMTPPGDGPGQVKVFLHDLDDGTTYELDFCSTLPSE